MMPPLVPRALVAAVTPSPDYESVAGDLCEEYARRAASMGRACADRWYWSQAFRSIPALLAYSRTRGSLAQNAATAAIVVCVLFAMLLCEDALGGALHSAYPSLHGWPFLLMTWIDAAAFGAVLAAIVRSHGVRLAFIASTALLAGFALPVMLGLSAPLPNVAWILLLGAIPAMSAGAAAFVILRRGFQ